MVDTTGLTVVEKRHPIVQKKIKKSLRLSLAEAKFTEIFKSLNTAYIAPFALHMQASAAQVGILGAFAMLLPSISQLGAASLIERYTRKRIIILGGLLTAFLLLPIMATAFLYLRGFEHVIWLLIVFVGLLHVSVGVIYPAWFSLMGSLVPENERGTYFSIRNRVAQFFGVLSMIAAALFLDYMKDIGSKTGEMVLFTFYGFFAIFTLSMVCRCISMILIARHYEPRLTMRKKDHDTLREFLKHARNNPFGRFVFFTGAFSLAVGIASPFFAVYLLKELGYSYTWFMVVVVASFSFQVIFLEILGKMSNRFGNILLTKIATSFIAATPLIWALSYFITEPFLQIYYLVFVAQIINGIGWASFNLATTNYVYDATQQKRQGYAISYLNLAIGVGYCIGALIGSAIVRQDIFTLNIIVAVLIISAVCRAIVVIIGTKYLQEVRKVKKFDPNFIIHQMHPIRGAMHQIHHLNNVGSRVIHHI